jgi:hypothetical protein
VQKVFNLDAVVVVTIGVAVQAMLVGMPAPRHLHRVEVDGQVLITVGSAVLFSYEAADSGLRHLAAVRLPEMGFTGRRVARVLGITQEYVSMLRARARAEGSAGLMRRRGRPAAWGARDLGRARSWRGEGVTDAAIGKRLGVHGSRWPGRWLALVGVDRPARPVRCSRRPRCWSRWRASRTTRKRPTPTRSLRRRSR